MNSQYNLFDGITVREYTTGIYNACQKAIESMSDEEILYSDFDGWIQYYVSKYTIQPIIIYSDNINQTLNETKIKKRNVWYQYQGGIEPEFYEISGYEIKFNIPFSGDYNLLDLKPNTMILANYEVTDFVKPKVDTCGSITLCLQFPAKELISKEDNVNEYVKKVFNEKFHYYKIMIGYVNQEVESFNKKFESEVTDLLTRRKNRAKYKKEICNRLHIPLQINQDVPDLKPVPLKITKKEYAKPPVKVVVPLEYCISNQDYENILKIINQSCAVMEATAKTSNKYEEEELRDQILATLGTHYINSTGGETFHREGKTDILIPFENKAAFIAECKVWHGIKRFEDAVKQLFRYSTWKDVKVAVILFNKNNKDFLSVIKTLDNWVAGNTVKHNKKHKNCWQCVIHEKERNIDFMVTICIYDITIG